MTNKIIGLMAALAVFSTSAFAAGIQKLEKGQYQVDASHSKVGFEISHLVVATVDGKFKSYTGTVDIADKFTDSKFEANVDINSIDTSSEKRDEHLKSADFFDVAKFPAMTFKSTTVSGKAESFKLTGDLTIKGVTKKVVFDGKFLGAVADPYGNLKAAFTAKTKISRKDFGLTWNKAVEAGPVVGDAVEISLKIEAGKPIKK